MPLMIRLVAAIILAAISLSCSSMSVRADHDSEVDFSKYSSFALFERPGKERRRPQMSELVDRRIATAMKTELQGKGFETAQPHDADFLITFHTAVRQRVVVNRSGWYGWGRWGRWGWGGGATRVGSYPEGSLVIDIIDRRRRELVWRGVGEGAFSKMNPSDDKVAKRVARIMRDFPPAE